MPHQQPSTQAHARELHKVARTHNMPCLAQPCPGCCSSPRGFMFQRSWLHCLQWVFSRRCMHLTCIVMAEQEWHCQGASGGGVAGQHAGGSFLCSRLGSTSQSAAVRAPQVQARRSDFNVQHLVQMVSGQWPGLRLVQRSGQVGGKQAAENQMWHVSVKTSCGFWPSALLCRQEAPAAWQLQGMLEVWTADHQPKPTQQ